MPKQTLRSLLLLTVIFATVLVAAVSETRAQSRPRRVENQATKTATRARRTTPKTPAIVTEKAAAKRVDQFLKRLDQLVEDYSRPLNLPR